MLLLNFKVHCLYYRLAFISFILYAGKYACVLELALIQGARGLMEQSASFIYLHHWPDVLPNCDKFHLVQVRQDDDEEKLL